MYMLEKYAAESDGDDFMKFPLINITSDYR